MRIHTDILTVTDLREAASAAGAYFDDRDIWQNGSRKRARGFNFYLLGASSRLPHNGPAYTSRGDGYAATWDQYGIMFAYLYAIDPGMLAAHFRSAEHFHWCTGDRFRDLDARPACSPAGHKWGMPELNITGAYRVAECTREGCTAMSRSEAGARFEELAP